MVDKLNLIVLGPQGSGKGTQAQAIVEKFGIANISTGVIFREAIKNQTTLGLEVKSIMDQGKLVTDEITNAIVAERLSEQDCQKGFILDGYPRNMNQAEFLKSIKSLNKVIEIWVSDEEVIKRVAGRRMCSCGRSYHIEYNPPKVEGICDFDGNKLFIREDEKPEALKQRLKIYHEQTEPLVEYYKKQNILFRINGEQPIAVVTKNILALFN